MVTDEVVARWIRPEIRALKPYHVPDAGDYIKLDAMENPYHWPEPMIDEWLALLRRADINRYPDPAARDVCARLRATMSVPEGMDLLLGNGSDELIQMILLSLSGPGRRVLAPQPGFVMYSLSARVAGLEFVGVPLTNQFDLDMPALREAIEAHEPAVIFIACPNNPTGNVFERDKVVEIIERAPGLVVIDEAYAPFTDATFMADLPRYPNMLVMRTVSKMGLAGLRLGLLAGAPVWLEEINKTRLPYNINVLTQVSASFALQHDEVFSEQATLIRADREKLFAALENFEALEVFPSEANFILFRTPRGRAGEIFESLRSRGILIKNLDGADPMLSDCLRVTVGRPRENEAFIAALRQSL